MPLAKSTVLSGVSTGGSFDQLIVIGKKTDARPFNTRFDLAATHEFNVADALQVVIASRMRIGMKPYPTGVDSILQWGIARHYRYRGPLLRVDELNDAKSYIINCDTQTVMVLDHLEKIVTTTTYPVYLAKWVAGMPWSLHPLSHAPHLAVHHPDASIRIRKVSENEYNLTIDSWAGPNHFQEDSFRYTYAPPVSNFSCREANSASSMLVTGILGAKETGLLYKEQFEAFSMKVDIDENPLPDETYSELDFDLHSLANFQGSVIRGNFSSNVPEGSFDVPSDYEPKPSDHTVPGSLRDLPP